MNCQFYQRYNFWAILVVCLASGISLWQGFYSIDPHHWGLMLSNTKDLLNGLAPYRDISINYGILTPIIQGTLFKLTSQSLISIQVATVACYAVGLWVLFRLAFSLTQDSRLSFYVLCSCVLIHPIVIYPWPNYIAFPFLMGGIFYAVKNNPTKIECFISGALFSLAALARAEYLIVAIAIFFIAPIIDLFTKRTTLPNRAVQLFFSLSGFLLPLSIFGIYLSTNNLVEYWFGLAWTLPFDATPKLFQHMSGFSVFNSFFKSAVLGLSQLNLRLIVIYLMILINIIFCLTYFFKRSSLSNQASLVKTSILSLLCLGQVLHLTEIFRVATGSIIGLVVVYVLLKKVKLDQIFFILTSIVFIFILPPTTADSGNYFAPSKQTVSTAKMVHEPAIFKYQLWPEPVTKYYTQLSNDMASIKNLNCGVKYHFNYSIDVFLHVISPFKKYQVLPFDQPLMYPAFKTIRPDFLPIEEKQKDLDIMIMRLFPNEEVESFVAPEGYLIYKKYLTPSMAFIPVDHTLMLMVPETCLVK
ncbi:hypothetical protein [Zwartia panacis]|uniref:hypothetical protein n=1 Tax=Zwartia panacis TaxID=2683345 RepID=UPI0025B5AFE6|nr:hypothetical protein [Zwartia panacis]MDN4018005.1 hypothetical protein [Zwartia panacis]